MPHRLVSLWGIVLGVLGLLLVVGLALVGADLVRSARTGPRWRRRLVAAALGLLSALGVSVAAGPAAQGSGGAERIRRPAAERVADAPGALARTDEWKRLTETWTEAEEVAAGTRGDYPFNKEGKKALLAALDERAGDVDKLVKAGRLLPEEAGLLKQELDRLRKGVVRKRPTELRNATCYRPMLVLPARDALHGIQARLPLLEKLAAAPTVHPAALKKVLGVLDADLALLANPEHTAKLLPQDREKAKAVAGQVGKVLDAVRAKLARSSGPALDKTGQWQAIVEAWRFAKPLADSHKSTIAQRKEAVKKLDGAKKDVASLAGAGLLSAAEAGLLTDEADAIRAEIFRDPPTDSRVLCYETMHVLPARDALRRLQKRLPLLKALAASGTLRPGVCEKVLPTVRADLKALTAPDAVKQLGRDKPQADEAHKQAQAALAEIDKRLAAGR